MSACSPAATPTPSPRPPATTAPTEAAPATTEAEATTEAAATTEAEATTEAGATEEATLEGMMPTVDVIAPTEEATAEEMATAEATMEETVQVVLPPTDEMTAEPTSEMMEATSEATMEASAETRNIIEVATADGNFTTLLAALEKAGLTETLEGDGPFTVFAPTDAAFEKLLADMNMTADDLLNNPDLANILKYHVVSGNISADQLESYRSTDNPDLIVVPTMDGDNTLDISFGDDDAVMINGEATVTLQNVEASNGVIHVIDTVLMPPAAEEATPEATADMIEITLEPVASPTEEATIEVVMLPTMTPVAETTDEASMEATPEMTAEMTAETRNIIEVATADGNFTTLLAALEKAGWTDELEGEGPFTVFAPTDEAFEKLLDEMDMTADELLDNPDLADILKYHVLEGLYSTDELKALTNDEAENTFIIPTLDDDKPLSITFDEDGTAMINDTVKVTVANIETSNGIIHVIDTVLTPPSDETTPEATAEATDAS